MVSLCQYCQKPFSQSHNRDSHERQGCWKQLEREPEVERKTIMTAAFLELFSKAKSDEELEMKDDKENIDT